MSAPLSYSDARSRLKEVLDDAERGQAVKVQRGAARFAVTDAQRLRQHFASTTAPHLRIAFDDGAWVASMDCRPFVAEAASLDDAIDELVVFLREYAEEWVADLQSVPNHREEWGLVQLVMLSSDDELRQWLRSEGDEVDLRSEALAATA